jgi:signal transduction histidine kinase
MGDEEFSELELKYLNRIALSINNYKDLYFKGLDLIKSEPDPQKLLLQILDDYLERLDAIPAIDLSVTNLDSLDADTREKVKALVLFGTQAALIKDNAEIQENLRTINANYRDLLSVVTHEFKNSLTSIYGYNRIIRKRIQDGKSDSLEEISNNIDRLTKNLFGLVETLFSMSLIEQGILKLDQKIFDIIEDSIKPVVAELDFRLQKKSMQVKVISNEIKNIYVGDERLFQLVFRNLILNAIQYGRENTDIIIQFERKDATLIIEVSNEGSGLENSKLDQVFDKFSRFHDTGDKTNIGIGLYAVKSIIELHKGEIEAASELQKWMRFIIRLPALL